MSEPCGCSDGKPSQVVGRGGAQRHAGSHSGTERSCRALCFGSLDGQHSAVIATAPSIPYTGSRYGAL